MSNSSNPSPPPTDYPCALFHPETIQPVSSNPWTEHIHLLLPATNSFSEKARGILLGPTPPLFHSTRRALDHITEEIYKAFRPALTKTANIPNRLYYPTLHSFRQDVGVRPAFYPNPNYTNRSKKLPTHKVYYISTSHEAIWKLLSRTNKDHETAKPTTIDGVPFEMVNFPKGPNTILPIIADINQTTKEFKIITTKRFRTPMQDTHRDTILNLPTVKALVPIYPLHCSEPVAYRLALKPTPQTVSIHSDTIHQLPGIPQEAIIPIASTDTPYADATRAPPKPTEPCPGLHAFQNRWSSFSGPPTTNTTTDNTTPLSSLTRAAAKKPRTTNDNNTPSQQSTALLSTASPTSSFTNQFEDDAMSHSSTATTSYNDNSQLTDFGGLDELIYQYIEDHTADNPTLRRRIEALLHQQPRPFTSYAEFYEHVSKWEATTT